MDVDNDHGTGRGGVVPRDKRLVNPAASQRETVWKFSNNVGDGHDAFHFEGDYGSPVLESNLPNVHP